MRIKLTTALSQLQSLDPSVILAPVGRGKDRAIILPRNDGRVVLAFVRGGETIRAHELKLAIEFLTS